MGQTLPKLPQHPATESDINHYISLLLTNNEQQFKANDIATLLQQILKPLRSQIPIQLTESKITLNPFMIRILCHEGYQNTVLKLIHLLADKLQQLMKRNLLLIKTNEWKFLSTLVSFILLFTDDKLIRTIGAFTDKRQQLNEGTKQLIQQLEYEGHKFIIREQLMKELSPAEVEQLSTCLISTMLKLINQRIQPLTGSSSTLQLIQQVQHSLFMLFTKLLFTSHNHKSMLQKARNTSLLKDLLKIGEYFMASGCDLCVPSVYESAILLLLNLITNNHKHLKLVEMQVNGLPTHLFKNLPVVRQKTFYDFVAVISLYSLSYIKEKDNLVERFGFNRLVSLKLISVLMRQVGVTSGQITQMLEEASLQMKVGMVERAFMTQIVRGYVTLIDDKIANDKKLEINKQGTSRVISTITSISSKIISRIRTTPQSTSQIAPSQISPFCRESHHSQILTKYLQSGMEPFSIKYKNKRYTIPYINVIQQIERENSFMQNQLGQLSQKFVYEFVLKKKVLYQHNDKFVWNEILPKIIHGLKLQGQQVRERQMSQISSNVESKFNVIGHASVISQRLLTTKSDQNGNFRSQSQKKPSIKFSRQQTEERGIFNQTTEQATMESFKIENKIADFPMDRPLRQKNGKISKIIQVKSQKQNQQNYENQANQKNQKNHHQVQHSDNLIHQPEIDKEELIFKEEDLPEDDVKIQDN